MRVYYFGCMREPGHYMFTPDLIDDREFARRNPWGYGIDGLYKKERLSHKDGWTAWGRADYTVDSRSGSHSTFLAEGIFTEEEMIGLAKHFFPSIAKRIGLV